MPDARRATGAGQRDWNDLRFVLAIERARTLSAAAQALRCNQSTVTRRLSALHDGLGERVLERRGGAYVLTSFGESLRPLLAAIEEQVLAVERAARGADAHLRGQVRLTTVESLATAFLAPRLPAFRAAHPEIELELAVTRRSADLSRREADVVLRLARPRHTGLIARRVGALGIALYASPEYLAHHRAPAAGARWDGHLIVDGDDTDSATPEAVLLASLAGTRIALRTISWLTRTAAVVAGVGMGALPCLLARAHPTLRRLGDATATAERELWLIVHRDLQHVGRVRAVLDFVTEQLGRHRRELEAAPLRRR